MNAEQMRKRLAEIQASLEGIKPGQDGIYSAEQKTEVDALSDEFDKLSEALETQEKIEAKLQKANASRGRQVPPATPSTPAHVQVGPSAKDKFGGFENVGEFMMAVRKAKISDNVDTRLKGAMFEKVGEDGGFLVPEELSNTILDRLRQEQESLLARTTQLTTGGNNLTIPTDESQPYNQGVTAYWTGEGKPITESQGTIGETSFKLHKLAVLVRMSDELQEDAPAVESWIKAAAPAAIVSKVNDAIISGNGAGKPMGIINSPFTVMAAKESMQTADTINAKNIINMYSRMLPQARAGAVWVIHPAAEAQLLGMKDDNDNYIYLGPGSQMNQSPYATLLGRPVIPMVSALPALGDLGDIIFANFSYYYSVTKVGGIKSATSIHMDFDRDMVAYRFTFRVDGKVPFKAPVTTQNGSYNMSAFVTLEAR